jgi:LCP family protein required for cell wall assembly
VSRTPRLERPPRLYPVAKPVRHGVLRGVVLGLLTYAIGLIPFFLLTPVGSSVASLLNPLAQSDVPENVATPEARPAVTPAPARTATKSGVDSVSVPGPSAEATAAPVVVPSEAGTDSRYAFLLLGYGGQGHDGAYLTDSMMLVVVDPDQKSLTMLSIPRDSWVPLYFDGKNPIYNKINTAYALAQDPTLYPERLTKYSGDSGPGVFAADSISRLFGVPVRYYLGLDFAGFRQMIDTVGGIDVDVPASFSARYPANDDPSIDASWTTVKFVAGQQHMNGERAIEFARARESLDNLSEGTDFARSRRQRLIIEAFKNRLFQPGGMLHLPQLIGIGASHVDTNYSIPDVAGLSQLALSWHDVKFYQTALTAQNFLEEATGPDGTYALVPSSADHSWAAVTSFVKRLWSDPASGVAVSQSRVLVENDTGVSGIGGHVSSVLGGLGYSVDSPTYGTLRSSSRLIDGSGTHAGQALAPLLEQDLQLKSLDVVEDPAATSGEVTLQLGSADVKAGTLPLPREMTAPASNVGILNFGSWSPDVGAPVPTVVATPTDVKRRTPVASRSATPDAIGTPSAAETGGRGALTGKAPTATPHPSRTPTPRPL